MNETIKKIARKVSYSIAPHAVSSIQRYRYLSTEAKKVRQSASELSTHPERFKKIQQTPFVTQQIESEFVQAMDKVARFKPSTIVEIGAFQGGTLALFTQVAPQNCRFLSVDIAFGLPQTLAFRHFGADGQKVNCISGDSCNQRIIEKVKNWLNGSLIDLLFIDGDHSYQGVKKDFENYGPMVRKGGIIIFHDIVEDYTTRFGTPTASYTGGVPKFWKELKQQNYQVEEVIENPDQDGYGIGILIK